MMPLKTIKPKRVFPILLTTLVVLGITAGAFCFFSTTAAARSYPAQVEDISGQKYYSAVKRALSEAEESIFMVMYVVEVNPRRKDTLAYNLVNELIRAKKRGIEGKVILDQNVDFVKRRHTSDWRVERKSYWCFKMLKDAEMDLSYIDLYGKKSVKEAFAIVAKKRVDNPKRKYSYVVGILRNKTRSEK